MAKWRAEPTILASRERISGISVWTEHLCLQAEEGGGYKLFTGHYQSLAHWEDFYDEETGDYTVPDEIDGFEVEIIGERRRATRLPGPGSEGHPRVG